MACSYPMWVSTSTLTRASRERTTWGRCCFSSRLYTCTGHRPEAEFLDVIGTKLLRVFLLAIHSHLYLLRILSPSPTRASVLKMVYNVNVIYRNLKSENSQDYAQKPPWNCTFMNSASVVGVLDEPYSVQLSGHARLHRMDTVPA